MTNLQLYLALGIPTVAVLASLTVSLVQKSGIREEMRELRTDMRELRRELLATVKEINTKIDLLTGKVYELMAK